MNTCNRRDIAALGEPAYGGYALGEPATRVQVPTQSGRLWLVRKRNYALIDFDQSTAGSQLAGNSRPQRQDSELMAIAPADHRLRALTTPAHEALDPEALDLIWGVRGSSLYLKQGQRAIHQ